MICVLLILIARTSLPQRDIHIHHIRFQPSELLSDPFSSSSSSFSSSSSSSRSNSHFLSLSLLLGYPSKPRSKTKQRPPKAMESRAIKEISVIGLGLGGLVLTTDSKEDILPIGYVSRRRQKERRMKVGKAQEEIKFFSKSRAYFYSYLLCRFILAVVAGLGGGGGPGGIGGG